MFKICARSNCIHNGKYQSIKNFCKNKSRKDGIDHSCRDCKKAYQQTARGKMIEFKQNRLLMKYFQIFQLDEPFNI